ncbi:hypothetical protein GCM10009599_25500 [Luteococcus peritonei]
MIGALLISAVLRAFVGQMFIIPSGSMENTLQVNDRVVVSKLGSFHRGDVVVFEDSAGWILERPQERSAIGKVGETIGVLPSTASNHLIKRVIGMPGDTVSCCDDKGRLMVNGVPIDESAYLYSDADGQVAASAFDFTVTVPKGRIFVMGDHRNASGDSRCHLSDGSPAGMSAFVPEETVVGRAVAIAAPLDRLGTLRNPGTFAAVPEPVSGAPDSPSISPKDVTC